jgi:NAD(P)-dependent dehydrogenase (short-subunit alcohol dehydrogenase family)
MAETLARKNYHVFATMRAVDDRNANAARAFRSLAERESLHLGVLELDVTNNESVEGVVDVVIAQTDRIDVLINDPKKRTRSVRNPWKPISSTMYLPRILTGWSPG